SGNDTVNTPPFSAALAVIYTLPTAMGSWDLATAYSHGGDYYSEPDNFRYVKQPKYDLVNASVKWTSPDDRYDVRLWGNNLTEEKYFTYLANSATSGPKVSPASPRTYGVTFGVHF
ncbi:MAG: TonB-dependent receptor, partial [Steroidobacteraceae bacterium]